MNWQSLTWEPLDGPLLSAAQGIAEFGEILRGAIEESASALAQAPISLATPSVARLDSFIEAYGGGGGEPEPVATFELMAAQRRQLEVTLDPATGSSLAGAGVVPMILARAIIEGIDGAFSDILGEGLNLGAADAATISVGAPVLVVRFPLRGADGTGVDLLVFVEESVPAEIGAHVVALRALGSLDVGAPIAAPAAAPTPARPEGMQAAADAAFAAAMSSAGAPAPAPAPAHRPQMQAAAPMPPVPAAVPTASIRSATFDELQPRQPDRPTTSLDLLLGVNLQVTVEIGRTRLPIRDILNLAPGSIVELDKLAGEPVDVLVNGRQIATGEVVVVDENFGVRITEIVSRQRRIAAGAAA